MSSISPITPLTTCFRQGENTSPFSSFKSVGFNSSFEKVVGSNTKTNHQVNSSSSYSGKSLAQIELDGFKMRLYFFSPFKLTQDGIGTAIMQMAPKNMSIEEVIDNVFENCKPQNILLVLDAILAKYPSFNLSNFDQLRRKMVEDADHAMNNETIGAALTECGIENDPKYLQKCQDLAFRIDNPYIYPLAKVEVLSSDYTLNFLWVNLNPQPRMADCAQNIFREGLNLAENAEEIKDPALLRELEQNETLLEGEAKEKWLNIKQTFTYRLSKWADLHTDATIYLWYDSALVTERARQNTDEMLKSISMSRGARLALRDIRSLTNMDEELRLSLHPGTALYYRVDLLKALIGDHMISSVEERAKYCVFTDIDVEAMPKSQLFDQRTIEYLDTKGYVFNRVSVGSHFENSFFIFSKESDEFREKHRQTIIEAASKHITTLRYLNEINPLNTELIMDSQFVFGLYRRMRRAIDDKDEEFSPRKVVKCPKSQFSNLKGFSDSAFQTETFRFVRDSKVPSTKWGRNHLEWREVPISWLKNWKADPLPEFNLNSF